MSERGDVLQLKRRIGFADTKDGERFVVVQATALNATLPTLLAVPLDAQVALYDRLPIALRVSGAEVGSSRDHVAIASFVRVVRSDHFMPGRVGRLRATTLAQLDETSQGGSPEGVGLGRKMAVKRARSDARLLGQAVDTDAAIAKAAKSPPDRAQDSGSRILLVSWSVPHVGSRGISIVF